MFKFVPNFILSHRISELLSGHEIMIEEQMDKMITIGPPQTPSGGAPIRGQNVCLIKN